MATTGKINGSDLLVYVDDNLIACCVSHDITMTTDSIDVTTKDSAGWREIIPGLRTWGIAGEGLTQFDATWGFNDLVTVWKNRTLVNVKFKTTDANDLVFAGSAYIVDLTQTAATEDVTTFSFTFDGTGVLTYSIPA